MDGQPVGTGLDELLHITDGTFDHQMHVQRQFRYLPQSLHHRHADGNVGHKQAVHHIHMNPVAPMGLNIMDIPRQIRKIRRQDRRCNDRHNGSPQGKLFLASDTYISQTGGKSNIGKNYLNRSAVPAHTTSETKKGGFHYELQCQQVHRMYRPPVRLSLRKRELLLSGPDPGGHP